jgi:hypothetical protein
VLQTFVEERQWARTAPPDESSVVALDLGSAGPPGNGIDAEPRGRRHVRDGARANITIGVFLVGKPRTDMSPFGDTG